ncbi:MAG: hypothetical protein JWN32_3692 [Solirubrobacterales bacterium]|nr:hypothetical protein [Solirubrobacterales bacterium]
MGVESWILRAPASVARAAAGATADPEERWMLRQPRAVRISYVREVIDRGGADEHKQIWMLRQPEQVRESFIAEVLAPRI